MRLALNLGYLSGLAEPGEALVLAQEAERLGYSCVWVAEAYGSDAPTVLAWLAGQTRRIGIGSAVMQIPARAPTMTAMTAATLDALSGGRFRLGIGVSGPQVSEGWYGVPFANPLGRTREYVDVVRLALSGARVDYPGRSYPLPLSSDPGVPGRPLKLALRSHPERVPIYLAAIGPRNLRLAGEIADGWLAIFCAPDHLPAQIAEVAAGRCGAGAGLSEGAGSSEGAGFAVTPGFDVTATVPVVFGDDPVRCADAVRAYTALYVGGMGSKQRNFYHDLVARIGYPEVADQVRDLYLAGRHRDAAAALPFSLLDEIALLGPVDRVAAGLRRYADAGVSTLAALLVSAPSGGRGGDPSRDGAGVQTLRWLAEALDTSGVGQ
jgi:F420-dependent oxidoreductase-like protein